MRAHQAVYPVQTMCRVLEVSRSGYYAWRRREPSARAQSDATLTARIREVHEDSRKTYGSPRIHAELQEEGQRVGRKRVARLMRGARLEGASRRRFVKTTQRAEDARPAPDLVDRDFSVSGPDQLWVADITYVPTWAGFLYLAVVLDAWSRRVVGWAMATHLRTELVLDALDMALWQRRPEADFEHGAARVGADRRVHIRHRGACAPKRHFHVRASAPLCACLSYSCGTAAGAATPLRSFRPKKGATPPSWMPRSASGRVRMCTPMPPSAGGSLPTIDPFGKAGGTDGSRRTSSC